MLDKREEILRKEVPIDCIWDEARNLVNTPFESVFNAMDEYAKEMCMDLLAYMASNQVNCGLFSDGLQFYFKGEWVTKEQLVEKFL